MAIFTTESLELLRQRVDLVEALSPYIELKRTGASYKALCPFHDEKSPSFQIQRGASHYHCFGCGAHGDAIQFLMMHQKLSFSDAVEILAQKFQVPLELVDESRVKKGPSKAILKESLKYASEFFHFCLLHSEDGHQALRYLYDRGIDLSFITAFQIGYAPKWAGVFRRWMHEKRVSDAVLMEVGLLAQTANGKTRDFFSDRILFPIHSYTGDVIGFSGRKFKEETFGGKYVNTPETPLFKKSRVLFGFNYSRRKIAKERQVIVVEGQIDTCRLIHAGFDYTVAGQGTAFGEEHVKELLQLGVNRAFLAMDGDKAGTEAGIKIGHLFQKNGVEVKMVHLPQSQDPDSFIRAEGVEAFQKLLTLSSDYLGSLVAYSSQGINVQSPAGKNELLTTLVAKIREWNHPVMVHETLKKLAHMLNLPEEYVGIGFDPIPNVYTQKTRKVGFEAVDPDRVLEADLLRWLVLVGSEQTRLIKIVLVNLKSSDFLVPICKRVYEKIQERIAENHAIDCLSLAIDLDDAEGQQMLAELTEKKINKEKAEAQLVETIQKMLTRNWMQQREAIHMRSRDCNETEALELLKAFNTLNQNPPRVLI